MVNKIKKETFFIFSLLFSSVIVGVGSYLSSNFSKSSSVLLEVAYADVPPPAGDAGQGGSGGCSASGDTGDGAGGGDGDGC
jgi:hypothetical protein